jgi:hypothetical protein
MHRATDICSGPNLLLMLSLVVSSVVLRDARNLHVIQHLCIHN